MFMANHAGSIHGDFLMVSPLIVEDGNAERQPKQILSRNRDVWDFVSAGHTKNPIRNLAGFRVCGIAVCGEGEPTESGRLRLGGWAPRALPFKFAGDFDPMTALLRKTSLPE